MKQYGSTEYYNARYEGLLSADKMLEQQMNRKCWVLLKQIHDSKMNMFRTGASGMGETWHMSLASGELNVTISSGMVGSPVESDVKITGWSIRSEHYSELHTMHLAVTNHKLFECPCPGIAINALYVILSGIYNTGGNL